MSSDSHRNRLALTYLAIIMVLSIGFSIVFYREATTAAYSGFKRQTTQLRDNIYFTTPSTLERIRNEGVDRFNSSVFERLVLLNLFMLIAGGLVSYYLAKRSLAPLETALETQSRFTSDAAHELRTPLTAMKTETEIALRSKKLTGPEARDVLKSNLEEVGKLQSLTDALLRLAKSNGPGNGGSPQEPVVITEVLTAAFDRIQTAAAARRITFELPKTSTVAVRGDRDQLVELFVVLFDNAVRYGKEKTAVQVTALKNDEQVAVRVADHGVGIAASDLPHIFERFYRADQSRTKNATTGYGLGLSVAEAIAKNHGGTITAASQIDEGTTITVALPRYQA